MPFVICNLHGGAVAPHACPHVSDDIWARRPPGQVTFIDLDGFWIMGWVCNACLDALNGKGLQEYLERRNSFQGYPPAEEIDPLIDTLDLQPMCAKCFEELSVRQ